MSISYFFTNLLNIKDPNTEFSYGIDHKVIRRVKYSLINANQSFLS